jgi:adenosylcobinamide amidohydrolase
MLTAAKVENLSMVTRQKDDIYITVIATAGWRHGESSGKKSKPAIPWNNKHHCVPELQSN